MFGCSALLSNTKIEFQVVMVSEKCLYMLKFLNKNNDTGLFSKP